MDRGNGLFGNRVTSPFGVTAPAEESLNPAYHTRPSGPVTILFGSGLSGRGYSVMACELGSMAPNLLGDLSLNHTRPSGPLVILYGVLCGVGA